MQTRYHLSRQEGVVGSMAVPKPAWTFPHRLSVLFVLSQFASPVASPQATPQVAPSGINISSTALHSSYCTFSCLILKNSSSYRARDLPSCLFVTRSHISHRERLGTSDPPLLGLHFDSLFHCTEHGAASLR